MAEPIQDFQGGGFRGKADRRFTQALVVGIDPITHSCTLDVGATDAQGAAVLWRDISFQPQSPPRVGDTVSLVYSNVSPHSVFVGGGQLGGQNSQGSIQVVGAVSSLAKAGGTKLKDDVTLSGTGGIVLNEVGQNIAIDGSGIGSPSPATTVTEVGASDVVGTDTTYAREDHAHKGVHSIGGLFGNVTLSGSGGIVLTESGNNIAIDGSGATGGVTSLAKSGSTPLTGAVTLSGSGGITLTQVGNNIDIQQAAGTSNLTVEDGSGTAIGTEPKLQLIGGAGVSWGISDDAPNSRVQVTLSLSAVIAGNNQTGTAYTFVLADAGKVVEGNNAAGITFTIPPVSSVAWPVGTVIEVFQEGAGQITIAAGAGVTLRSDGSKVKTFGQYATIGLRMRASDEWVISGDLA